MEKKPAIVAKRLTELREGIRISQARLAAVFDIDQPAIFRYENAQSFPPYGVLMQYAEFFNVSLDYIFGKTDDPQGRLYELQPKKLFETVKANLERMGYTVSCFETAKEATDYMDSQIDGKTVGFGGSMTLEEMGLYERLITHNDVIWHQRMPQGKTNKEVRLAAGAAEVYVSSVNGLAQTGEIINIDGNCNRVASIFYGHEKVYLVVGENKIAKDYNGALWRARNIASPLNAKRLGMKTPCAVKGDRCYDCQSPDRICRGLSVLWSKPMTGEFEIVLIAEKLGY